MWLRPWIFSGLDGLGRVHSVRGAAEIRTRDGGFADLCLTTWLRRHGERSIALGFSEPGRSRSIVTFRKTKGKHFRCKELQPEYSEDLGMVQLRVTVTAILEVAIHWSSSFSRFRYRLDAGFRRSGPLSVVRCLGIRYRLDAMATRQAGLEPLALSASGRARMVYGWAAASEEKRIDSSVGIARFVSY